jgi:hypothetical protein
VFAPESAQTRLANEFDEFDRALGHAHAGGLEGLDLLGGGARRPEMIAPAWPIRRPGGAVWPAMKPTTGFFTLALDELGRFLLVGPADLAHHHDGLGLRVGLEGRQASMKLVPLIGSPPMPTQVLWPRPARVRWCTIS